MFALAINIFSFLEGVVIVDAEGNKLGQSVTAAQRSIVSTTFSRICIAAPGMCKLRVSTKIYISHDWSCSNSFYNSFINSVA